MGILFLSYAAADRDAASDLATGLGQAGWAVRTDDVLAGDSAWWAGVLAAIQVCDVFVPVLSRSSAASEACRRERDYAVSMGLPILTVRLDGTVSEDRFSVDFATPDALSAFRLVGALAAMPSSKSFSSAWQLPPRPPFQGLDDLTRDLMAPSLTREDQLRLVDRLQAATRTLQPPAHRTNGGGDSVARAAAELAMVFRFRPDLDSAAAHRLDELLPEVGRQSLSVIDGEQDVAIDDRDDSGGMHEESGDEAPDTGEGPAGVADAPVHEGAGADQVSFDGEQTVVEEESTSTAEDPDPVDGRVAVADPEPVGDTSVAGEFREFREFREFHEVGGEDAADDGERDDDVTVVNAGNAEAADGPAGAGDETAAEVGGTTLTDDAILAEVEAAPLATGSPVAVNGTDGGAGERGVIDEKTVAIPVTGLPRQRPRPAEESILARLHSDHSADLRHTTGDVPQVTVDFRHTTGDLPPVSRYSRQTTDDIPRAGGVFGHGTGDFPQVDGATDHPLPIPSPLSSAMTEDAVRHHVFRKPPLGRRGYDERSVHDLLEAAAADLRLRREACLHPGRPGTTLVVTMFPDDVRFASFKKPSFGKRGYDEEDVDRFLEELERSLNLLDTELDRRGTRVAKQ